jgi:hypothetical protein
VEHAAHAAFEGVVDHFVLGDAGFAFERGRDDVGGEMIAVAGEVADVDLGIGEFGFDEVFDVVGVHGHGGGSAGDGFSTL